MPRRPAARGYNKRTLIPLSETQMKRVRAGRKAAQTRARKLRTEEGGRGYSAETIERTMAAARKHATNVATQAYNRAYLRAMRAKLNKSIVGRHILRTRRVHRVPKAG